MKNFVLEPRMRATIGGAFYPSGYSMVMFPSAEDANRIGHQLLQKGVSGDEIYLRGAVFSLDGRFSVRLSRTGTPADAAEIGKALADAATHEARRRGLALKVIANPSARRFYESCGFSVGGDAQTRFGPALRMTR